MTNSVRATIIMLAWKWPKNLPITRAWAIEILYILDIAVSPGCLGLEWDTSRLYPTNNALLKDLDKLGCIKFIRRYLTESMIIFANNAITEKQKEGLEEIIGELSKCKGMIDAYKWKNQKQREIKNV